jgi:hypothetical protein
MVSVPMFDSIYGGKSEVVYVPAVPNVPDEK